MPRHSGELYLNGVSCGRPGTCLIVGSFLNEPDGSPLAVATARGKRAAVSRVKAPANGAADRAFLSHVACVSGHGCIAVGTYALRSGGLVPWVVSRTSARPCGRRDSAAQPARVSLGEGLR